MKKEQESIKITPRDITLVALMVAVIEVCKLALSGLPNIELTTFWIILFSLCFGRHVFFAIPVFILVEGAVYGFGLWWVMYLYAWPLLALAARQLHGMDSALGWSLLSGAFGLLFGALCAIPYFFIGAAGGGPAAGLNAAFGWWVAGIPWDLAHGAGNFCVMLALYRPVTAMMKHVAKAF